MFFLTLVLGSLATVFPFLAVIMMMSLCGKNIATCLQNPVKSIFPFFIVPILLLAFVYKTENVMLVSDALYGVGLAVTVFLISIRRNAHINDAIARSALIIIAYGLWRTFLFGDIMDKSFELAIASLQKNVAMFQTTDISVDTFKYMRLLLPSIWTIQQIIALIIGYILFQKNIGIAKGIRTFALPRYYSIVLLAIMPLYFWNDNLVFLINALLSLCVLPILQGLIVVVTKTFLFIPNRIIAGIMLAIILLNIISYLFIVLIGLADQWLDFRNLNNGGISA